MDEELENIWEILEKNINSCENRIYRRLDLTKESGLRLGIISPDNVRELLIQIDKSDDYSFSPPKWIGMKFDIITLDVPEKGTSHISLYLEDPENKRIFTMVCSDIVESLSRMDNPSHRTQKLKTILDQWSSFFKNFGPDGLSPEAQRGLYGELTWLELLIKSNYNVLSAVGSWTGCKSAYHDFENKKNVVEVKTTMTKEPRRVHINNERQLDERGLDSLHLFILSLHKLESGGQTLPQLVENLRDNIKGDNSASALLEKSLKKAGYFSFHEKFYTSGYVRKKQETFLVKNGFPRIIDLPQGVGDISYSLTISACSNFEMDLNHVVTCFTGG